MTRTNKESILANNLRREELDMKTEKDEVKKDCLKNKLHPTASILIEIATSNDNKQLATEPCKSCQQFFQCQFAGMVNTELTFQFHAIGLGNVAFVHGTVQALFNTSFHYNFQSLPSIFSAFRFSQQSPLQDSQND